MRYRIKVEWETADGGSETAELGQVDAGPCFIASDVGLKLADSQEIMANLPALLNAPDCSTLLDCRNRALLALLVGCGLRRAELASLNVEHIQMRDSRWAIPHLAGQRKQAPDGSGARLGESNFG